MKAKIREIFRTTLFLILTAFLFAETATALTRSVPSQYATIQTAIDASSSGDVVLVSPGTYVENIDFKGKNITVGSLFLTTGDESYISQTIIDGNRANPTVYFHSGEDSTAKLVGLSITNGIRGIYIGESSPTIDSCRIYRNEAPWDSPGGGVLAGSRSLIKNCAIYDNYARHGGGICLGHNFDGIVTNCNIYNNRIFDAGGSQVSVWHTLTGKLQNSIIREEGTSTLTPIEFRSSGASPIMKNLLIITDNNGSDLQENSNGVFFSWDNSHPIIVNATIINTSGVTGNLLNRSSGTFTIINSIAYGYTLIQETEVTAQYSRFDNQVSGTGNVSANPLFVDPASGDYHLSTGSPCIDSGTSVNAPSTDLDGLSRPQGAGYDMGAYEGAYNPACYPPVKLSNYDYFNVVQDAYDNVNDGDAVLMQTGPFSEYVLLNRDIATILRGGYNCSYDSNPGYTTIKGSLTITNGTVTVDKLIIAATPDLVAYYPFNGNANDESGNGNHGTVNGATLTADRSGNLNRAYLFNGVDNYIEATRPISADNSFTISCWIRYEWQPHRIWIMFFGCNSERTVDGFAALINANDGYEGMYQGETQFGFFDKEQNRFDISTFQGNWLYIVTTYDAQNQTLKSYLNGSVISEVASVSPKNIQGWPLYIGKGGESFFKGSIDEVRIYNRALSASEILNLYNNY